MFTYWFFILSPLFNKTDKMIKHEGDSFIGTNGSQLDSYVLEHQQASSRPLFDDDTMASYNDIFQTAQRDTAGDIPDGIPSSTNKVYDSNLINTRPKYAIAEPGDELEGFFGSSAINDVNTMGVYAGDGLVPPEDVYEEFWDTFTGEWEDAGGQELPTEEVERLMRDFDYDEDLEEKRDRVEDINEDVDTPVGVQEDDEELSFADSIVEDESFEEFQVDQRVIDDPDFVDDFGWENENTWWNKLMDKINSKPRGNMGDMGDIEMMPLGRSAENLPLLEQPSVAELSELGGPPRQALSELVASMEDRGMAPAAIAQELGIGISKEGGMWISRASLGEYLTKQAKGFAMSPFIGLLVSGLNKVHEGVGDMVSLGLIATDVITTGDPLGVLMYGVAQLWDMASVSRQKVIDNDTPDKEYGTKMGYVREGDTWYPAIFNSRYKSTGLAAADQEITIDYGHDIVWKMDGAGNFVPMIPGSKSKNFVASDDEWLGVKTTGPGGNYAKLSSKEFVTEGTFGAGVDGHRAMNDATRDWYFLSDEDMKSVMRGDTHLEAYTDDYTKMNSTARQLNDWRKALDESQNWKWSSAVKTMGPAAAVNNYAGSRGLQRILYESTGQLSEGVFLTSETDYDKFLQDSANRTGDMWDSGHSLYNTFSDYLLNTVLRDHVEALYHSQLVAAKEAKFDELYGEKDADATLPEHGGTVWSAMYMDMEKDMPTAASSEELQQQLHVIELLNDRTPAQRNYLAQKVQTRYWMQQITAAGGGKEMADFLLGDKMFGGQGLPITHDLHKMHQFTASSLREFQKYMADDSEYNELQQKGYIQGFAMPWQNGGETIMPTFTGALRGKNVKEYIDEDWLRERYDKVSSDAWINTKKWIDHTGKKDPNLVIDGTELTGKQTDLSTEETIKPVEPVEDEPEGDTIGGLGGKIVEDDDLLSRFDVPEEEPDEPEVVEPEEPEVVEPDEPDEVDEPKFDYEKWIELGKDFGFIDQSFGVDDDRTTSATSHGTFVDVDHRTESEHIVGDHPQPSLGHSAYLAMQQWAGGTNTTLSSSIKVV